MLRYVTVKVPGGYEGLEARQRKGRWYFYQGGALVRTTGRP